MHELEQCLDYCLEQNGIPECKNCGLSQEIIDHAVADIREAVFKEVTKILKKSFNLK